MKKLPSAAAATGLLAVLACLFGAWYALEPRTDASGPRVARVPEAGFPMRVELPNGDEVTLSAPPTRVLPANAGVVDYLIDLVDAERVVALPVAAVHYSGLGRAPAAWKALPRFDAYSAEIVLALEPDLVLSHSWQSPETTARIRESGIAAVSAPLPRSWDEVLGTLSFLGRLLDADERAREVAADIERRLAALSESPHFGAGHRALSYSNLGTGGSTAGAGTTVDIIFELAGIENAASVAGLTGQATLDHERLLTLDPDFILVASDEGDTGAPPSATYLFETQALASLDAIRKRRIASLPIELFSTTSLELVRAAETLHRELDRLFER